MNTSKSRCVIVGAGHAAAQLAPVLRQKGWTGDILVIGNEHIFPYQRPLLSKEFLSGAKDFRDILIRPPATYVKANIQFALGAKVSGIDRRNKHILLENGETITYTKLVLTTGSRVRKLSIPGADLPGVCYLRNVSDVEQIHDYYGRGKKAVIIGGGYIGLEAAAVFKNIGMKVTVIEAASRILERVTTPAISSFFARVHAEEGIRILTQSATSKIEGKVKVERVICQNGQAYDADLVVIGIGVIPATELAVGAGLTVDNGIVVDEFARTSDEDILAAGDCTTFYSPIYKRNVHLESVQNASDQATVVANTICGVLTPYDALPWFWSDQFDIKLQIAGLSEGFEQAITRGDISASRSFAVFYLKSGQILAVDAINRPVEFMICKRLISRGTPVDMDKLADETVSMKEILNR